MALSLPVEEVRGAFLAALRNRGAVVLTAPTGSGKSTRIPPFLLDELPLSAGKILVLQPRRLAARMLAERVAEERGVPLGEEVGFQTRYERLCSGKTRLLFVTEGILTRMLMADPRLSGVACLVFDEFHERSMHTDLGLAMAQHLRKTVRPDLRLVVMSATMDAAPVSRFLGEAPVVQALGRLYPVDISYTEGATRHLPVWQSAALVLRGLLKSGAQGDILIFMPGGYEIRRTIEECSRIGHEPLELLPLYGDLPPQEQRRVMKPAASGYRKVIVATNIAETSLTIPGVRHVIDGGLARVARFDAVRGVDTLETEPIARDAAEQRAGRAGREATGSCHRLWSWVEQSAKAARTLPELFRMDLTETALAVAAFGFTDPMTFPWYEAPQEKNLRLAWKLLQQLQFLSPEGKLTELGRRLGALPLHPRLAILLGFGAESGCLEECAVAAAILSERPLLLRGVRVVGSGLDDRRTRHPQGTTSDFLLQMNLLNQAKSAKFDGDFCTKIGVNSSSAREIWRASQDFLRYRERLVNPSGEKLKENAPKLSRQEAFLQAVLRAFPERLARRADWGTLACEVANGRHGELAKESAVRDEPLFVACEWRDAGGLQLSLCSAVKEDWLLDLFPDAWTESDETFWDAQRQQVVRRQKLSCLGVVLEDKMRTDIDREKAGDILAQQILSGKAPFLGWQEDEVEHWMNRAAWVAEIFPEEKLPIYDEEGQRKVLAAFCIGENSLKQLKNKNFLQEVKNLFSWQQQQFVEQMAPGFILLPNGRKMKLHYAPGQPPKGSAKIYDLYDLPALPVIAKGRARVLLDILAPNFRTVQITDDLANFWKVLYPKIKPELARRYPRHPWR